jgi:hypothetical protein
VIGLCGEGHIAAEGADPESADVVGVDVLAGGQVGDRGADVLGALDRVFEEVRLAAALALVGGVEDQRGESLAGGTLGVDAGGLLLDGPARTNRSGRGTARQQLPARRHAPAVDTFELLRLEVFRQAEPGLGDEFAGLAAWNPEDQRLSHPGDPSPQLGRAVEGMVAFDHLSEYLVEHDRGVWGAARDDEGEHPADGLIR